MDGANVKRGYHNSSNAALVFAGDSEIGAGRDSWNFMARRGN
jgi:hypothetical protein